MNFQDAKKIADRWVESLGIPEELKGRQVNTLSYLHDEKDPVLLAAKKRALSRVLKKRGARLIHEVDSWSIQQSQSAAASYMNALKRQLAGNAVTQAEIKTPLCSALAKTEKAVRFKLRHISSVLVNSDLPYLDAFKPLPRANIDLVDWNETEVLQKGILELLKNDRALYAAMRTSAAEPPAVEAKVVRPAMTVEDPPERDIYDPPDRKIRRLRVATKVNYAEREANNRSLGQSGEELAVVFEKQRLAAAGRNDLADKITWVSREHGDGLGYDIESFGVDGRSKFIEVKTTKQGKYAPFFLSANELAFSKEHPDSFFIYRVFDCGREPRLFILQSDVETYARIVPTTYRVVF